MLLTTRIANKITVTSIYLNFLTSHYAFRSSIKVRITFKILTAHKQILFFTHVVTFVILIVICYLIFRLFTPTQIERHVKCWQTQIEWWDPSFRAHYEHCFDVEWDYLLIFSELPDPSFAFFGKIHYLDC